MADKVRATRKTTPKNPVKINAAPRTLRLNAADNLIVAVDQIDAGVVIDGVTAAERIPMGHKMAAADMSHRFALLRPGGAGTALAAR